MGLKKGRSQVQMDAEMTHQEQKSKEKVPATRKKVPIVRKRDDTVKEMHRPAPVYESPIH
jgi:hypothetical protein